VAFSVSDWAILRVITRWNAHLCRNVHFSLAASWTCVWASLRHDDVADVARRRVSGLFATPDSFRLNQSPLGAVHLPQAPTSVGRTPLPEGLSLAQVRSSLPAYAGLRSIAFILTEPQAMRWASLSCLLSLTSWQPDGVLGLHTTPDPSGGSEPPGRLPPAPGSYGNRPGRSAFSRANSVPDIRNYPRGPELA